MRQDDSPLATTAARFGALGILLAVTASQASAQVSFSCDNRGPTVSAPDAFGGVPITEGDILTPSSGPAPGPNPPVLAAPTPPGIMISAGPAGLGIFTHPGCVGHPPMSPCPIELDALSYGNDPRLHDDHAAPKTYWFSVDGFALGAPVAAPPTVFTEGIAGPAFEAASDVFADLGVGIAPAPPLPGLASNTGMIDGNGFLSASGFVYPGVGLIEPFFAATGAITGDNLDAVDVDGQHLTFPVYYSLDASYVDPFFGPLQSTALANGFVGGDVLVTAAVGAVPAVYAPAPMLGLDLIGQDRDDLDALALWENGVPGFQPAPSPYAWLGPAGTASDMLLFSVRRGSAVIGMPDSLFGIPIEEGDILSTPIPAALGGLSPFPSLWVAAENIGLVTVRSSANHWADDLDALDVLCEDCESFPDCNGNGIPDDVDITSGTSTDVNGNLIPDECELIVTDFCYCTAPAAPCGNPYPAGGCENGTGVGAILTGSGTGSVANDDLLLHVTQGIPGEFAIIFMGTTPILPITMGNGIRCVGGSLCRFVPPFVLDAVGDATVGPMVGWSLPLAPSCNIVAITTWNFQAWYRNPGGPCGASSNTTNALSITFTP